MALQQVLAPAPGKSIPIQPKKSTLPPDMTLEDYQTFWQEQMAKMNSQSKDKNNNENK